MKLQQRKNLEKNFIEQLFFLGGGVDVSLREMTV